VGATSQPIGVDGTTTLDLWVLLEKTVPNDYNHLKGEKDE
jgi:hypothetical protein